MVSVNRSFLVLVSQLSCRTHPAKMANVQKRSEFWRQSGFICAALWALTVAAFWPVFQAGFVRFDDPLYVNPIVQRGLTVENIRWAFHSLTAGFWHPITWLSLMLDAGLFGPWPGGYHATNLLLHLLNSTLLFVVLRRMTGADWRSAFVAGLFAVHPLHVESVAWIAERKDVLSAFFLLLTLLAYARYVEIRKACLPVPSEAPLRFREAAPAVEDRGPPHPGPMSSQARHDMDAPALQTASRNVVPEKRDDHRPRLFQATKQTKAAVWYLLSIFWFALGLMSKAMLVTVPVLLLLLDYWPLRRWRGSCSETEVGAAGSIKASTLQWLLLEKVPFFVLALAASGLTVWAQRSAGALRTVAGLSLSARAENAVVSYCRYLGKLFWPVDLAVFYPHPSHWPLLTVIAALVLLVTISIMAMLTWRGQPWVLVGWCWFVISLAPVIGLVQVGEQAMADRYAYVPAIGIALAIAWYLPDSLFAGVVNRVALGSSALVALLVCAWFSHRQTLYWHDSRTLFAHTVVVTHDNATAQNNLGVCLVDDGDLKAAESHFLQAVRISPRSGSALLNLADCYDREGRLSEAIEVAKRALAAEPHGVCHFNLACLYLHAGDLPQAETNLIAALRMNPDYLQARFNLAVLRSQQHRIRDAEQDFKEVLRLQPDLGRAHNQLGALLVEDQRWNEAIAHFEAGLRSEPGDIEARKSFGIALASIGRYQEAEPELQTVVQVSPDARTQYFLGLALQAQGRMDEALAHYREAVRLDSEVPDYLNDLAWLLATGPQQLQNGAEALQFAERACRLSGGKEARYWGTLDAAYASAGRFEQAIETAKKARELALAAGQTELARAAEQRMALYQERKPFRL
jgi:tetratricopeptide (TPR) repeat protein